MSLSKYIYIYPKQLLFAVNFSPATHLRTHVENIFTVVPKVGYLTQLQKITIFYNLTR